MSKRWLAGVLLFSCGFGSALLVRLTPDAVAASAEGVVEEGLRYVDGTDFTLKVPTGANSYLVVVARKPGLSTSEAPISSKTGATVIPKKELTKVTIYRLTPVGLWQGGFRPCHGWEDCPVPQPIPPPPPLRISNQFLDPSTRVPATGTRKPVP